jgi:hypothetical protein
MASILANEIPHEDGNNLAFSPHDDGSIYIFSKENWIKWSNSRHMLLFHFGHLFQDKNEGK